MELGTDQRKLEYTLQKKVSNQVECGVWISQKDRLLSGWEARVNASTEGQNEIFEELSAREKTSERILRRGPETPLLNLEVSSFMSKLKHATFTEKSSLSQTESFLEEVFQEQPLLKSLNEKHFLIQLCTTGFLAKFLPSQFGVYLRYLDQPDHSLLILFKKGRCEAYQTPDLTGFKGSQGKDSKEVIRFLKTRYGVPIQLMDTTYSDWLTICESENPLRTLLQHVRTRSMNLTPFRWSVVFGASIKAFF